MLEKILVVDDEKEIADLIEVYLQNENMDVYKFYSGEEALVCIGSSFTYIIYFCLLKYFYRGNWTR